MPHYPTILLTTATKVPPFRFIGKLTAFLQTLRELQRL